MNYNGSSTYSGNVIPLDAEISPGVTVAAALMTLLSSTNGIGPQVLAAAALTPIASNMVKVKDQTINGNGSESSPWGP